MTAVILLQHLHLTEPRDSGRRVLFAGFIAGVFLFFWCARTVAFASEPLFFPLQKRLIADGLEANYIYKVFQRPEVKLEAKVVAANLIRRESALNYDQFLTAATVDRASRYLKQYDHILKQSEDRFGVPPSVVVAILMVETRLGTYTGRYGTFNVLSTMAAAVEPQVRQKILAKVAADQMAGKSGKQVVKRLDKRANRGYGELKALIRYLNRNALDPFALKGSSEGAIGIPQFMPSNIERYGRDGNNDGLVDLFNHEDAIASVACFLEAHRWKQAAGIKAKKRVLLSYNHSSHYANAVYRLAELLAQRTSRTQARR